MSVPANGEESGFSRADVLETWNDILSYIHCGDQYESRCWHNAIFEALGPCSERCRVSHVPKKAVASIYWTLAMCEMLF